MKCPFCGFAESKVVDSRPADDGEKIRRRRECLKCLKRFTTYEVVETTPLMVIKKDGTREPFESEKLLNGLLRACEKRPVNIEMLLKVIEDIQSSVHNDMVREIHSTKIGDLTLMHLKNIDQVAYIRFASVYKKFDDIQSFLNELDNLQKTSKN